MTLKNPISKLLLDEIHRVHAADDISTFQLPVEARLFVPVHAIASEGSRFALFRFDLDRFHIEDNSGLDALWKSIQNASKDANRVFWSGHDWYFVPALLFSRPIAFLLIKESQEGEEDLSKLYLPLQDITEKCLAIVFDRIIFEAIQFESKEEVATHLIQKLEGCIGHAGCIITEEKPTISSHHFCTLLRVESGKETIKTLYISGETHACALSQSGTSILYWRHQFLADTLQLQFKRLIRQWENGRTFLESRLFAHELLQKTTLPVAQKKYENAFFYDNHNWVVWFKGKSCSHKINSPQGMHALHILLSASNRYFEVESLHDKLVRLGVGYSGSSQPRSRDVSLDANLKSIAEEDYKTYSHEWHAIKKKSVKDCTKDNAQFLGFFISLIDNLIKFDPENRERYIGARTNVYKKLADIVLELELDPIFIKVYTLVTKGDGPTGNIKNSRDTIIKSIRRAIDNYKTVSPELYTYLSATIVVTNRNGGTYKPFIYVPELSPDENVHWNTEP